jgi:transketolase
MVSEAAKACDALEKEGVSARLVNMHTVKPIDRPAIVKAAKETGAIVTAEEHTVMGGFGSAVAEVVSGECPVPVKMVGVKDKFGVSGEPDELFRYFGLTSGDIVEACRAAIKMKK